MSGALAHLHAVELCDDLPGAYCARQVATWGADVLVIEPPSGSPLRGAEPIVTGRDGVPLSLTWEYVVAGKRAAVCDVADAGDRARLAITIAAADVLITDWSPARLAAAGLDYATLSAASPGLVMVSITPFGVDGPYAGFAGTDLVIQALSGMLSLSGYPDREPLKLPGNILPYACGVSAFVAALAALHERRSTAAGQFVEVACLEAVAALVLFTRAQYLGEPFPRRSGVGTVLLPCADGYVLCSPAVETVWQALLTTLGIDPDRVPASLRGVPDRYAALSAVREFLTPYAGRQPARTLFEALGSLHVVAGLYETPAELLADPQLAARGFFSDVDHPQLGRLRFPSPAARLGDREAVPNVPVGAHGVRPSRPQPRSPAPRMAENAAHTGAVQPSMDNVPRHDSDLRHSPSPSNPLSPVTSNLSPIRGVRVLDLTGAWIGPYAAMLLADLGADVIKIEAPRRPDIWRIFRPATNGRPELPPGANPRAHPWNTSFYYNAVNLNKRGVTLDLASAAGRELFLRLVAGADVVMENFTPRVMENFGLGYEALRRVRPHLIMASFSGYGAGGPYRDYKANGATIETIAGWTALFGYPDAPPMSLGEMEADPLCGLQMAALTLVALEHREQTGEGQRIDGAMFDAAAGYIGEELLRAGLSDEPPARLGNGDRTFAPQGVYRCAGSGAVGAHGVRPGAGADAGAADAVGRGASGTAQLLAAELGDEWIAISVRDDVDWRALISVASDAPRLHEPRFATRDGRRAAAAELDAALGEWTGRHEARDLMLRLQAADVPAGVVLKTDAVPADPQFVARGWFRPLTHPDLGERLYAGAPWRFSHSPLVWRSAAPRVGEHSAAVLSELLAIDEAAYAALVAQGVSGSTLEWPEPAEVETA